MTLLTHTIPPFYDKNSKILILGSFPSPKSRELGFYYGHPQNRFWKVISAVFKEDLSLAKINEKKEFLSKHNIALFDVIYSCEIIGASDNSIKNVTVNDISYIKTSSKIQQIFTTGKKSSELYNEYIGNDNIYLPSTSPLNASFTFDRLVKEYEIIKKYL